MTLTVGPVRPRALRSVRCSCTTGRATYEVAIGRVRRALPAGRDDDDVGGAGRVGAGSSARTLGFGEHFDVRRLRGAEPDFARVREVFAA